MNNFDDSLQDKLQAIENGQPLPDVLHQARQEDEELAALIQFAGEVRAVPRPSISAARAARDRQMLLQTQAANSRSAQARRPYARLAFAAAAFALVALFAFLGISRLAAGSAARLAEVNGLVEVAASNSDDWRIVSAGDTLRAGQRLRTYDASSVALTFPEGSRTVLSENTEISLAALKSGLGGTITLELLQNSGNTSHRVVPFNGKNSAYVVNTPGGQARVHGTTFDVAVETGGLSRFSVTTGKVEVVNAGRQVFLNPGQASLAGAEIGVQDAAYTFSLRGTLQSIEGSVWTVDGVKITLTDLTQITGTPAVGSIVQVDGRVLADATWQADTVAVITDTDPQPQVLSFTGVLESMESSQWKIGGNSVLVNSATLLDPDIKIGDPVRVTFRVLPDGTWLALSIERLGEEQPQPTATPITPTSPAPASSLVFQPVSAEVQGCTGSEFSTQGMLVNTGSAAQDARLEALVIEGAGYLDSVSVSPERVDVPAGGSTGFTVNVGLNGNWASATGQKVTVRLLLSHASQGPVQENAQFDFTIRSDCEPTATPSGTPTATITTTPGATTTPSAPASVCTGANPQPTGMRLAAEFGVTYEEIMGWFCQGFGFGEISTAYELSRESGVPVADIFTMRRSGMGWGNIKKLVNSIDNPTQITGTPQPGLDKDNNNKDKDKPVKPTKKPKVEKTKKPNPSKKP